MAYISGICNNVNPGPTLYALMEPALTTAGFTLVDTVVISTRTHQVWKSAAASNTANLDWYLDIGYQTTGAGNLTLQCFEYYDPATDLGYRGLYTGTGVTTIDAATSSRYGATGYALETNWIGATTFTAYDIAITASSFNYYMSITTNRVIMLVDTDQYRLTYVGLYTPDPLYAAKAGAGLYPLVGAAIVPGSIGSTWAASSASAGSGTVALTRVAPATSLAGAGWGTYVDVNAPYMLFAGRIDVSATTYPAVAIPMYINAPPGSQSLRAVYGTLTDVAAMLSLAMRGDTVTIDGATWVTASYYPGSSYYPTFMFKAI